MRTFHARPGPVDIHTHFYQNQPFILPVLDAVNIRRAAILSPMGMDDQATRLEYERRVIEIRDAHPDRFVFCPTIDVSQIDDPNYAEKVLKHLDVNMARGAKGIKIWKVLGCGPRA